MKARITGDVNISIPKDNTVKHKKKRINYSTIRTNKQIVCQIKALNILLGDKTIADTLNKMLRISKSYLLKDKDYAIFDAYYRMWMKRLK